MLRRWQLISQRTFSKWRWRIEPVASLIGSGSHAGNPTWGYTRIRGGLKRLSHAVGRPRGGRLLHRRGPDFWRRGLVRYVVFLRDEAAKTPWKTAHCAAQHDQSDPQRP
jgi:hypothetical protein